MLIVEVKDLNGLPCIGIGRKIDRGRPQMGYAKNLKRTAIELFSSSKAPQS